MNTEQLLDRLAEYQAQADLLEMDKRRLLDEVKIPAEVLAAQDEANKKRQEADSLSFQLQCAINKECREAISAVADPEMPAEFVAALAAARAKREGIEHEFDRQANVVRDNAAALKLKIDADLNTKVEDVYDQVSRRKSDIVAEFDYKAASVLDNIAKLTADIKAAVKAEGKTVKGQFYQAVYVKGRVTWITDMLDGMIIVFPALEKARKVGEPSVTLRKV